MKIRKFDVYDLNLPDDGVDHSQSGVRPYVVIQNDIGNKYSPICLVLSMTSQKKKTSQPTHAIINKYEAVGLEKDSIVLAENIRMVDKSMLRPENKRGYVVSKEAKNRVLMAFVANATGRQQYISELCEN